MIIITKGTSSQSTLETQHTNLKSSKESSGDTKGGRTKWNQRVIKRLYDPF